MRSVAFVASLLLFVALTVPISDAAVAFRPRSIVTTLSGSGLPGITQGAALTASYVLPVGVAVASDDSVLVADAGANQIRRIKNGISTIVAGQSALLYADAESWSGGYVDGPALHAEFNRPTGVAVGRDGRIFVADNGNHCIREIVNGRVTTFAGGQAGNKDGTGRDAEFGDLNAITIDEAGDLYVTDDVAGIRRISSTGVVTTLPFKVRVPIGISARRLGGHSYVAFTDTEAIHLAIDDTEQIVSFKQNRMPGVDAVPVLTAWGITIVNENTVAVTDAVTSTVRLIRFPVLPFITEPDSDAIAGELREEPDFHGGYHDGPSSDALFSGPRGIAQETNGDFVIADSGNRRIRLIAGADARETVLPDFSNFSPDSSHYDIVMIGQSYLFGGVLWPDSIPGRLESVLNGRRASDGPNRPVHVDAIRADGMSGDAMLSLVSNYIEPSRDIRIATLLLTPTTYLEIDDLVAAETRLRNLGIELVVGVIPLSGAASITERPYTELQGFHDAKFFEGKQLVMEGLVRAYRAAGLTVASVEPVMVKEDRGPTRLAMFNMWDNHMTVAGQATVGETYAATISALTPWAAHRILRTPLKVPRDDVGTCPEAPTHGVEPQFGAFEEVRVAGASDDLPDNATVKSSDDLTVIGWAADRGTDYHGRALCMIVDGHGGVASKGTHHTIRIDAVEAVLRPEITTSGFRISLSASSLGAGKHRLDAAVYGKDGVVHVLDGGQSVNVVDSP